MKLLLVAFICSALSFPAMVVTDRALPRPPAPERVQWQEDRSWFHNMKNETTEAVRADAQWWSKFLAFVVVTQAGVIAYMGVRRRK